MSWFIIYFLVMGIIVGIIPRLISKNIGKAIDSSLWDRGDAIEKVNTWLLIYSWAIVLVAGGLSVQLAMGLDENTKELDKRLNAIEQVVDVQKDTVTVQSDTINIKDVIYDFRGENSN